VEGSEVYYEEKKILGRDSPIKMSEQDCAFWKGERGDRDFVKEL